MKAFGDSLHRTIEEHRYKEPQPKTTLDEAAIKWAAHSLQTYDGELLTKALAISKAAVEFTAELLRK